MQFPSNLTKIARHAEVILSQAPRLEGRQNKKTIDSPWSSSKRYQFHGVIEGIDRYCRLVGALDWLENVGLILKIPIIETAEHPLTAYTEESRFKLYVFDVGILGALSGLAPATLLEYQYGTYKGYFAENFVAQEFTSANCKEMYAWQDGRSEVEFIRNIHGNILPIEVKSGHVTHAKSLHKFAEKYSSKYRTIMSGRPFKIDLRNGIHNYPLYLASRFPIEE